MSKTFYTHRKTRKVIFRTSLLVAALVALIFCVDLFYSFQLAQSEQSHSDINYYYNITADDKVIALTFDDGPEPGKTREIMDILNGGGIPATFFLVGSKVAKHPEIVQQLHEEGFEIGNHTFTHSPNVHNSLSRLKWELNSTAKAIEAVLDEPVYLYRPPFLLDIGSDPTTDPESLREPLVWAEQSGYVPVGADVDSLDWKAESAAEIYQTFFEDLDRRGGHLALFHDGNESVHIVEALPGIIQELKDRGYRFVKASEILGIGQVGQMQITQRLSVGSTDFESQGEVSALQKFLKKEGVYQYEVTGYFGPITNQALRTWQQQKGLNSELGFTGEQTLVVITEHLYGMQVPGQTHSGIFNGTTVDQVINHLYIRILSSYESAFGWLKIIVLVTLVVRLLTVLVLLGLSKLRHSKLNADWAGKVSIIIPVYNEGPNVAKTIVSALNNDYKNLEIIVVNDGSTDDSEDQIKSVQQKHPRKIKLISIPNSGKSTAVNVGIAAASGEVVVATDGDSILSRKAITNLVKHFADPEVGAVAGKIYVSPTNKLLNIFQHLEYAVGQNVDKAAYGYLYAVGVVPGAVGAWRKADLEHLGGFADTTLAEDQDMTLGIMSLGKKVVYEPDAIAYTEAPHTTRDFLKQRFRWIFGTIQCAWKYKHFMFNVRSPQLGIVALPNTFIFSIFIALLAPIIDLIFILAIISGHGSEVALFYAGFTLVDLAYGALGMIGERKRKWTIVLLPLQRIYYRAAVYYVMIVSLIKAIEGTEASWYKVKKIGLNQEAHPIEAN